MATVFGNKERGIYFSPDDDCGGASSIVTVVALSIVELVDESFEGVGVRDFLEENDVGLVVFDSLVGIGAESAVEGDDAQDGAFEMSAGGAFFDSGSGESSEGFGFVGFEENGEDPDAGDEHGEAGPEEEEGSAGSEEAEASPDPDGKSGVGRKGSRHSGVEHHRDEVQTDGGEKQCGREKSPQSPDAHESLD